MLNSMRMGRADMMFALLVLSLDFFDCYSYGADWLCGQPDLHAEREQPDVGHRRVLHIVLMRFMIMLTLQNTDIKGHIYGNDFVGIEKELLLWQL